MLGAVAGLLLTIAIAGDNVPPAIEKIGDAALSAPPELAADILLCLCESGRVKNGERQARWIDTAFQLAPSAEFPNPKRGAVGQAYDTDSDSGMLWRALDAKLDTTSLRCRAVRLMLPMHRARARQMFSEIQLHLPPLTCRDGMRYVPGDYYDVLGEIFDSGFTQKERREGKHIELLEDHVRATGHPAQIEPVAELLLKLKLPAEDFNRMVGAFAARIKEMRADDRTFTGATHHGMGQRIWDLIDAAEKRKGPSYALVEAYRSYLVRHLGAARCADSVGETFQGKVLANTVSLFNQAVRTRWAGVVHVPSISEEEAKPAKAEGQAEVFQFWETPRTREILMQLRHLRFADRTQALDEEERRKESWEVEVRDFLRQLETWQKDLGDSPVLHFHRMCYIYRALLDLIPAGVLRRTALASWVSFVGMSPVERDSPPGRNSGSAVAPECITKRRVMI